MLTPKQKKPISARDQEIIDIIINATCAYFSTDKAIIAMPGKKYTKIRRICYYLIKKNTDLSNIYIAGILNRTEAQALRGIDLIDIHRGLYAGLSHELNDIANLCNKFEPKQYEWLILH